jgi:hypothetical protein
MTDLNVNEKAIFAYLGVTSRDEICAYASLSSNDDRYTLGLYRKVDVYSIPEYPRNSWDVRDGSKTIEFTATQYYAKYGDWIGEFGNFDHLCRYAKTLDKAYGYANTSAMTVAEMVAASELKTSDIRLTNLRHDCVNKLNIHLVDNSTITRQITDQEAREYFALNNDIAKQRQYVAELFNREYRQPQPMPSRPTMSVDEERYSLLSMQRKDNALPTDLEQEYQQLRQKLYGYDY